MATKKVRILQRVGNPGDGAILAPGATVDLPEVWADRYVASGHAELVEKAAKPKADTPKDDKPKGKGKGGE